MADGIISIRQDSSPDRKIDNEVLVIAGNTVYRQRVQTPESDVILANILAATGGGLTDAELRASPVAVDISGSFPSSVEVSNDVGNPVPVTGTVTANTGLAQPLTDAQLRASAVPVTGTVTTTGLTDTELRASPVPVSGTVAISNFPATQPVSATNLDIRDLVFASDKVDVSGSTVSVNEPVSIDDNGGSITVDGPIPDTLVRSFNSSPLNINDELVPVGLAYDTVSGKYVRLQAPSGVLVVQLSQSGTENNVDANITNASLAVTGPLTDTELRASPVPVSLSSDVEIGAVELKDATSGDRASVSAAGALKVDGSAVTQPVSGTVAVTQSTSPWVVSNTVLSVVGGGTEAAAQRVTIANDSTGVLSVDDNGASLTVDGTIAVSGDVTVVGKAADGAAVAGNPVLIAGQDGTNAQSVRTDTTGNQGIYPKTGVAALSDGGSNTISYLQAESGGVIDLLVTPLEFNGTTWDRKRGNTNGSFVQGPVADGAAVAGNPVLTGGFDGTNAQTFLTSSSGELAISTKINATAQADGTTNSPSIITNHVNTAAALVVFPKVYNGSTWDRLPGNTNGIFANGNVAHDGVDAGNPVKTGGRARSGTPTDVADLDRVDAWYNLKGALGVHDAGGSLTVDVGTALPAGTNNIGDVDIVTVPAPLSTSGGGTEATALRVTIATDSTGVLSVDDNGGSLTVDGTVTATVASNKVEDVAHASGETGDFILGVRNDTLATRTSNDGDYSAFSTDVVGALYVQQRNGTIEAATVKVAHLDMTSATTTNIVNLVSGKKIRVIGYQIFCNESVATNINFVSGSGTTRVTGSPLIKLNTNGQNAIVTVTTGGFLFETVSGEALRVTQDGATDISIAVQYIEV